MAPFILLRGILQTFQQKNGLPPKGRRSVKGGTEVELANECFPPKESVPECGLVVLFLVLGLFSSCANDTTALVMLST